MKDMICTDYLLFLVDAKVIAVIHLLEDVCCGREFSLRNNRHISQLDRLLLCSCGLRLLAIVTKLYFLFLLLLLVRVLPLLVLLSTAIEHLNKIIFLI